MIEDRVRDPLLALVVFKESRELETLGLECSLDRSKSYEQSLIELSGGKSLVRARNPSAQTVPELYDEI